MSEAGAHLVTAGVYRPCNRSLVCWAHSELRAQLTFPVPPDITGHQLVPGVHTEQTCSERTQ